MITAWHGTNFKNLESIAEIGLKPPGVLLKNGKETQVCVSHIARDKTVDKIPDWANGIFVSPSIFYCAHPAYSKQIISKKRLYPVQKQNQSAQQEHKISEGEEVPDQEEVGEPKGLMNLSKHAKHKKKRKSKKKCWRCKSPHHIKRNCPNIKCYYCGKLGHIKSNCYYMKTDKIYSWLMEMEQNYREYWPKKNQFREHIKKLLKEALYLKDGKKIMYYGKTKYGGNI